MKINMDKWPSVPQILAAGAVIVATLIAFAFLLKLVLPAIGVAIGLGVATATSGLATAGVVATWFAPVAAGGTAVIALMVSLRVLNIVTQSAADKPYEWTLPLLGVAAGILVNLSEDLVIQQPPMRLMFGGIAALWVVIAGACYKRKGWRWKVTAALLYLLLPSAALGLMFLRTLPIPQDLVGTSHEIPFREYLSSVSLPAWIALCVFALIAIIVAAVERLTASKQQEGQPSQTR
jgi:hypothetical protein